MVSQSSTTVPTWLESLVVTVKNSGGEIRTRCVTAGSTAFLSVVAQTRRGFLSETEPAVDPWKTVDPISYGCQSHGQEP